LKLLEPILACITTPPNAITKSGQDALPIYLTKKAQEGFSPSDATYMFSNAPSIASSLSMMLPGLGITKGISLIGKSLANANNVGKILKATGKGLETAANTEFGAAMITVL